MPLVSFSLSLVILVTGFPPPSSPPPHNSLFNLRAGLALLSGGRKAFRFNCVEFSSSLLITDRSQSIDGTASCTKRKTKWVNETSVFRSSTSLDMRNWAQRTSGWSLLEAEWQAGRTLAWFKQQVPFLSAFIRMASYVVSGKACCNLGCLLECIRTHTHTHTLSLHCSKIMYTSWLSSVALIIASCIIARPRLLSLLSAVWKVESTFLDDFVL